MRSRTIREGSAGLLILLGIAALGGLILWLRGFDPSRRSYRLTVEFPNADGIQAGAPVRYRGVTTGKISAIRVSANHTEVDIKITPATVVIPKKSIVQTSQSGFVGETFLDIIPTVELPANLASANPLGKNCDSQLIVCDGDYIQGTPGVTLNQLTDSVVRFLNLFSTPEFVADVRSLTRNSSNAAAGVAVLTREVTTLAKSVRQELGGLTRSTSRSADSIGAAANQFGATATQINLLLSDNRTTIAQTLSSIRQSTGQVEQLLGNLSGVLDDEGTLFQNLEQLSSNAVAASSNLRNFTEAVGSRENVILLQQTLDSARVTFENAQKITSDLDDLTGDPRFRQNIRNLINSLNRLVSSTQQLQQQTAVAQVLAPLEIALNHPDQAVPTTIPESAATTVFDPRYQLQPFIPDPTPSSSSQSFSSPDAIPSPDASISPPETEQESKTKQESP